MEEKKSVAPNATQELNEMFKNQKARAALIESEKLRKAQNQLCKDIVWIGLVAASSIISSITGKWGTAAILVCACFFSCWIVAEYHAVYGGKRHDD